MIKNLINVSAVVLSILYLSACGSNGGSSKATENAPAISMPADPSRYTIPYNRITLEVNATYTTTLTAINQTLAEEHNRTIQVKGVDSHGTFYLCNIPLIKGANTIRLQAANKSGGVVDKNITINADANQSLPLAMRATVYAGVQSLDTTVEIGTGLNATEYLLDIESDGKIDTIQNDTNFTLHLTDEGRYRPRVTVRTAEGLLYSSGDYALSLDILASADQKDPKGAEPVDVAKEFVEAIRSGDRARVEEMVGYSKSLISFIYDNELSLKRAKRVISEIDSASWKQTYRTNGSIEVKAMAHDKELGDVPIFIEVMFATGDYSGQGRMLYISDLH